MTVAPFFFFRERNSVGRYGTCTSRASARRGGGPDTIRMILSNNIVILHGVLEPIYHMYQTDII